MVVSRKFTSPFPLRSGSRRIPWGHQPHFSPNFFLPHTPPTKIQNVGPRNASRSPRSRGLARTRPSYSTSTDPVLSTSPPSFKAWIQPPRNTLLASTPSSTHITRAYQVIRPRRPIANHPRSLPRTGRTTSLQALALIRRFRPATQQRMGRCSWIRTSRR